MHIHEIQMRERIQQEIQEQYGSIPPFLEIAYETPGVFASLWQQTRSALIDNPLHPEFKELLLGYLAHFNTTAYSFVRHICTLFKLGMSASQIQVWLTEPLTPIKKLQLHTFSGPSISLREWPSTDSRQQHTIFSCCVHLFFEPAQRGISQMLSHLLSEQDLNYLSLLLAYARSYLHWTEIHPKLSYLQDVQVQRSLHHLLTHDQGLANQIYHYNARTYSAHPYESQNLYYQEALRQAPSPLILHAEDGEILLISKAWEELSGYSAQELQNISDWLRLACEDHAEATARNIQQLYSLADTIIEGESEIKTRAGEVSTWEFASSPLSPLPDGRRLVITLASDITWRKQLENEWRRTAHDSLNSLMRLQGIIESVADGLIIYDNHARVIHANRASMEMLPFIAHPDYNSLTLEERTTFIEIYDEYDQPLKPENLPTKRIIDGEVLQGKNTIDVRVHYHYNNDPDRYLNISGAPLYNRNHQQTGAVMSLRDVTERRQLEQRTHQALEALLSIAEVLVHIPYDLHDLDTSFDLQVRNAIDQMVGMISHLLQEKGVIITTIDLLTGQLHTETAVLFIDGSKKSFDEDVSPGQMKDYLTETEIARLENDEIIYMYRPSPIRFARANEGPIWIMTVPMFSNSQMIALFSLVLRDGKQHCSTAEESLAQAVARLVALVLERKRLLGEFAHSQARVLALNDANRRMDDFLGMASHELKTPVTTIKGNIQLVSRRFGTILNTLSDPTLLSTTQLALELLDRADKQVDRLTRLVNDLLDISRIQANKLTLRTTHCDLIDLAIETIHEQQQINKKRMINLEIETTSKVTVIADADRLRQVMTNYISNALKYSPVDQPIAVHLCLKEGDVIFEVRDKGPGIAQEEQEMIWERFYRIPGREALGVSSGGLGMGLHICKTIIERHHGQVGIISEEGKGSSFWFSLPLISSPR